MTYLEAINKILVRLRMSTVADLSDPYTQLVGQFVNQAKEEIEDAGPWRALRTNVDVVTVASTPTYLLTGTNERSYVMRDQFGNAMAYRTDAGSKHAIQRLDVEELRRMDRLDNNPTDAEPVYFTIFANAGVAERLIQLYPAPNAIYNYKLTMIVPQAELTSASTVITVPSRPVWMLAAAYAANERGEELSGTPGMSMMQEAVRAVNDAMLTDFGAEQACFFVD